jgi:hypothetical protein
LEQEFVQLKNAIAGKFGMQADDTDVSAALDEISNTPKILYIIRTTPLNDFIGLDQQAGTWLEAVKPENVLISTSHLTAVPSYLKEVSTNVLNGRCPVETALLDQACKEGQALIRSVDLDFDFAFFINDVVLVRPRLLEQELQKMHTSSEEAFGITGCYAKDVPGFCGGGGYAISKGAIEKMINGDPDLFYEKYMDFAHQVQWSDITTSHFLEESGIQLQTMEGLMPWRTDDLKLENLSSWMQKGSKVITMNYLEGPMQRYFDIFEEVEDLEPKR